MSQNKISIIVASSGVEEPVIVETGTTVGEIRSMDDVLDEVGAPNDYTFAIGGAAVSDDQELKQNDKVTFRPVSGEKG